MSDARQDRYIQSAHRDLNLHIASYNKVKTIGTKNTLIEHLEYMLLLGRGYFSSVDKDKITKLKEQLTTTDEWIDVNIY